MSLKPFKSHLAAVFCGLLFGMGLAASGMTDTRKVLGFLDIFGHWDPTLAFVMAAALVVTAISFPLILKQPKPRFADAFDVPTNTRIDAPLITGAALFGIGWGLFGYCPGPALTAVIYGYSDTFIFVAAMVAGMALTHLTSPFIMRKRSGK